jgi:hypothetical protein
MKTLLLLGLYLAPLWAHHSMAGFDRTQTITLEGTVKEFSWANPHSWIELEVTEGGKTVLWNFEMTAPAFLARAGWKRTTIKPGDRVTIVGNPLKSGDPGALFVSITLADGTRLTQQAAPPAAKGATK